MDEIVSLIWVPEWGRGGICIYRMAKIYCHINQWDANVQYFAILHADKYCTLSRKSITLKIHSL